MEVVEHAIYILKYAYIYIYIFIYLQKYIHLLETNYFAYIYIYLQKFGIDIFNNYYFTKKQYIYNFFPFFLFLFVGHLNLRNLTPLTYPLPAPLNYLNTTM
jgi:hypothetical protein